MNWETITGVTEVAGLVAVVASLIYIGAQTKQANDHATATSETAWMDALNRIWDSWSVDERTISILRQGFGSFNQLNKNDQATFQMKVGPLVNHWLLARQLEEKGLLDSKLAEEIHKIVISVLSTPGGMEYWEHDAKATPDGLELLAMVRENMGDAPTWIELMPWWGPDQ
jgi:hypothetical protein